MTTCLKLNGERVGGVDDVPLTVVVKVVVEELDPPLEYPFILGCRMDEKVGVPLNLVGEGA